MALVSKEKQEILFFLGCPGKSIVENYQIFNSGVDDRLKGLTVDIEVVVRAQLKALKNIDKKIICAEDRLSASKVDDITLNEREIELLRKERFRKIRELSDILDIVVNRQGASRSFPLIV